jgi:hypothetical protein
VSKEIDNFMSHADELELRVEAFHLTQSLAAWRTCAEALAADLRGCSDCCDCADCVCRASHAEFERLTSTSATR